MGLFGQESLWAGLSQDWELITRMGVYVARTDLREREGKASSEEERLSRLPFSLIPAPGPSSAGQPSLFPVYAVTWARVCLYY